MVISYFTESGINFRSLRGKLGHAAGQTRVDFPCAGSGVIFGKMIRLTVAARRSFLSGSGVNETRFVIHEAAGKKGDVEARKRLASRDRPDSRN